jgi:rhamnosyltransferase
MISRTDAKKKMIGVVVTYFPAIDSQEKLRKMASQTDRIVIVDNSADQKTSAVLQRLADSTGAELILNNNNLGLGAALNRGAEAALQDGADWIVFFDQDSDLLPNFRKTIEDVLARYSGSRPLGILGGGFVFSCDDMSAVSDQSLDSPTYSVVDQVITSGSAYRADMLRELGPFKDEYFIDMVDTEYCWRAKRAGFQVVKTEALTFVHTIGRTVTRSILGRRPKVFNHDPIRRYYMGRNMILLLKEYFFSLPLASLRLVRYEFRYNFVSVLLFESSKAKKLNSFFLGMCHGIIGRFVNGQLGIR